MSSSLNEFLQPEIMQRLSLIQQLLIGAWDLRHYDVMRKVYSLYLEHIPGIQLIPNILF